MVSGNRSVIPEAPWLEPVAKKSSRTEMKVRVAQFELHCPEDIWGLEGYVAAEVLFRSRGAPLGWLRLPTRGASVFTKDELAQLAEEAEFTKLADEAIPKAQVEPGISVVVCTRDRPLMLRRCLKSLEALDYENL